MDGKTDQTNFWLAWHATCAAVDCTCIDRLERACSADPSRYGDVLADLVGTQQQAKRNIAKTNTIFVKKLNEWRRRYVNRNSDLVDEVEGWVNSDPSTGCAFALLEGHLYAKETINGRPFKDYLFEMIATRSGGMDKNLGGYVTKTLDDIAKRSFSKTYRRSEKVNEDGEPLEENDKSLSTASRFDFESLTADERTEINEVAEYFRSYVEELCRHDGDEAAAWTDDNLLSLYCAFNQIPVSNPEVVKLSRLKKSSLSVVYKQTVGNLLLALRGRRFSDKAIAWAAESRIPTIIDEIIGDKQFYPALEAVRRARIGGGGKVEKR